MLNTFLKFTLLTLAIPSIALANNHNLIPISVMNKTSLSKILPSPKNLDGIVADTLIRNKINLKKDGPYFKASIQVSSQSHDPYLIVYLFEKSTFNLKTIKISLNKFNSPINVDLNYQLKKDDISHSSLNYSAQCPDIKATFVAASPLYSEFPIVQKAIDEEYDLAQKQGYVAYKITDKQAIVENYLNWLSCPNLKGFAHVGHGTAGWIMLDDDTLNADSIKQNVQLNKKTIVSFNSCEVFNDPLKSVMIDHANAQRFTGGISPLYIWGSTQTYACAWKKMLEAGESLSTALEDCKIQFDGSVPNNKSPLYIINNTQSYEANKSPLSTIYIKTNNGESIKISKNMESAEVRLADNDFLAEIYVIKDDKPLFCHGFSKEPGLKSVTYWVAISSHDKAQDECLVNKMNYDESDNYGLGGRGADYLLR